MLRSVLILSSLSTVSAWVSAPQFRCRAGLNAAVTLDGEVIRGEISPLGSYVLVKTKDTLTATEGGILLPDQVNVDFSNTVLHVMACIHLHGCEISIDTRLSLPHSHSLCSVL
jgi:Chaperonin 10 Kd subunit